MNHFVLSVLKIDNADSKSNIIFTIRDAELYVPVVTLSSKDNQKYQNFLTNDFKNQCIGNNIKQKVRTKYDK